MIEIVRWSLKIDIAVQLAKHSDIRKIVDIHIAAFPEFFLTSLGPRFLQNYYCAVSDKNNGEIIVAKDGAGHVVGFAAYVFDAQDFYRRLGREKIRLGMAALSHVLLKPSFVVKIFSRILALRSRTKAESYGGFELVSIGVSPLCSGKGVGNQLLLSVIGAISRRGGGTLSLRTDITNNDYVISFYEKNGFHVKSIDEIGKRKMYVMQRSVD